MEFSPYQNIIFNTPDSCGLCDKLIIAKEKFYFQATGKKINEEVEFLDTNPTNFLNVGAPPLFLDFLGVNPTLAGGEKISLYYNGKYYFYFFNETLAFPAIPYGNITVLGNITYVEVSANVSLSNTVNKLIYLIDNTIGVDSGGVVNAVSATDIIITGTQFFTIENITIVNPLDVADARLGLNNMYYEDGKLEFFNISSLYGIPTTTPSFFDEFTPLAGNLVKINVNGENRLPYDLNYTIEFKDASYITLDTIVSTSPLLANSQFAINEQKNVVANVAIIVVVFDSPSLSGDLIGFSVDDYTFKEYDILDTVEILDCNDVTVVVPQTITTNSEFNLIELDFSLINECCFKVKVTDSGGNLFVSNSFEIVDFTALDSCLNNYVKLSWFDTCNVDGVNYKDLPFVNEVYLIGYKKRSTMGATIETFTSASGKIGKSSSLTYPKFQLFIVGYGDALQYIFERIFEHKFFFVNDTQFTTVENYELTNLGQKRYTGRIDIIETGKTLNKKNCCCDG
jgi:hypothetical protein